MVILGTREPPARSDIAAGTGARARYLRCDGSCEDQVMAAGAERRGRPDVLVHPAGRGARDTADGLAEAGWDASFDVAVKAEKPPGRIRGEEPHLEPAAGPWPSGRCQSPKVDSALGDAVRIPPMVQAYSSDVSVDDGAGPHRPSVSSRRPRLRWQRDGMWRRGIITASFAVILTLFLFFHSNVPNRIGNLGSLLETFLPWLGLAVPLLLAVALLRRSATALIAVMLPAALWLHLFGGLLVGKGSNAGDLTVLTHNVNAQNPDPVGTAKDVIAGGADIVALEELAEGQVSTYERQLKAAYPYHSVQGTVGLWSKLPLSDVRPVDIRLGWVRAMRATVATKEGPLAVYVAHLPSVRVKFDAGFTAGQRDRSADALGDAIAAEKLSHIVLLGDLNGTMNDRALANITSQMRSTQGAAGDGFGFSWPAAFPMARIDQIMVKGVAPTKSWVLAPTGSDHRPVAAQIKF